MGCTSSKTGANVYPGNKQSQSLPHFVSHGSGGALTPASPTTAHRASMIQVTVPPGTSPGQTIRVQAPNGPAHDIMVPHDQYSGSSFTVEFSGANSADPSARPVPLPPSSNPAYTPPTTSTAAYGNSHATASTDERYHPNNNYYNNTNNNRLDDGFVSGFNNPHYTPPPQAAATVLPDTSSTPPVEYPTVQAVPVSDSYPAAATASTTPNYSAAPAYHNPAPSTNTTSDPYAGIPSIFRPP